MSRSGTGSCLELFGTGIIMGIVHVLTGPDHLSALATLSGTNIARHHALLSDHDHDGANNANEREYNSAINNMRKQSVLGRLCLRFCCNKNNSRYQAFLLGVRWGIGHSIGLLLVGGTLIVLEQSSNDEWINMDDTLTAVLESFVGVFMLIVGVYGLCKAFRNREENVTLVAGEEYEYDDDDDLEMNVDISATQRITNVTTNHIEMSYPERDGIYRQNLDDSGRSQRSHHEHLEDIISQMERHLNQDGSSIYDDNRCHSLDISERVSISAQRMSVQTDQNEEFFGDALRNSMRSTDGTVMTIPLDALLMDQQQQSNQQPQYQQQQHKSNRKTSRKSSVSRQNSRDFNNSIQSDINDIIPTSSNSLSRFSSIAVPQRDGSNHHHHYHYHQIFQKCCCFCTPGTLALATGIVHGVAGPGGVLGVIPAVQLKEARLALLYLGTFCLTSTLVMGGFAAFYGRVSEWMAGVGEGNAGGNGAGSRIFQVEVGSSSLSIIVGIVWLTLLSMGKLEEVFP
ncbi:hypothetical protein ACHAXS_014241 [Conticribra weissflogii]